VSNLPTFSEAELEDARLAYLKNYNYRSMNCGRGTAEIITVVGTSRFQASLRCVAEAPRPWRHKYDRHLPALLVPSCDDLVDVAVLIDGRVVGYLQGRSLNNIVTSSTASAQFASTWCAAL
jgi:hypothetical protein